MKGDLEGIFVVAVEQAVAAPYASGRLADVGARVIKVERPEGDFCRYYDGYANGESSYFIWLNRGKESIALNLHDPDDRFVLARLLEKADVFIQNLAPGVIDRLGFPLTELRQRFPLLITCSISGYGDKGPYRDRKAYDLLVQAECGLTEITGNAAGRARIAIPVCDIAAGMTAYQGILQALIGRARTGVGRHVSVSLYHALADWMNVPFVQRAYGGHTPARAGLNHPTLAPYGAYACKDGGEILFSVQNEREWRAFCEVVLRVPALETDARFMSNDLRVANRLDLDSTLNSMFSQLLRDDVVERLEKARIAYGHVNTLDDLMLHPQNRYILVRTPSGVMRMLAPGLTHDGEIIAADRIPSLGEHGQAIRRELGLCDTGSNGLG